MRLLNKVEFAQSVLTRALFNLSLAFIDFRIPLVSHFDFLVFIFTKCYRVGSKMFSFMCRSFDWDHFVSLYQETRKHLILLAHPQLIVGFYHHLL